MTMLSPFLKLEQGVSVGLPCSFSSRHEGVQVKLRKCGRPNEIVRAFQDYSTIEVMELQVNSGRLSTRKRQVRAVVQNEHHRGPESTLYSAVCPLVYAYRVFGIAPFEFVDDSLTPSNVNIIYSLICLSLYSYIMHGVMLKYFSIDHNDTPVLGRTETAKTVLNFCVAIINIFMALWSRKKISEVWNDLQDYDEKVDDIGYARNERNVKIYVWSTLLFNLILWTLISRLGMYAFFEPWTDNVRYMIIYTASSVSISEFSGIVLLLGQRFNQLNLIAEKNLVIKSRWTNVMPIVDAKTIERLHDQLMVIGETLGSIYSWSLMIWLGNLSFHIVSDLYFVIKWILANDFQWCLIFCMIIWIIAFNYQLILLNFSCHYASTQARAMSYIMLSGKRWLYTRDRDSIVETLLHMINRKLHFSAGGCFDVDLPLLSSIAGLMTTYLVILLQFD